MKTNKKYKPLTVDEAAELLRENKWEPVDGVVFRDAPEDKWPDACGPLRGVQVGTHPFRRLAAWRYAALVTEETQWEVGDCVEVVDDNHAPQLEAGAKGIVLEPADKDGDIRIRQTSPNPCGNGKWMADAADLRPWVPGYGYMPNGERVPEREGWELAPEDDLHNLDGDIAIYWHDGDVIEAAPSDECDMDSVVTRVKTGAVRAVYRRKQPALQVRERAYYRRRDGKVVGPMKHCGSVFYPWTIEHATYTDDGLEKRGATTPLDLIAEVPAPSPKMVPFDGPEDLPEWPVIWVTGKTCGTTLVRSIIDSGVFTGSGVFVMWADLFKRRISPDRRNWQVAGKEVPSE